MCAQLQRHRKFMDQKLSNDEQPFWRAKTLEQMSPKEWEQLCDGCAQCCLIKLEDEDDGKIYLTQLSCRLLDTKTCRCSDYTNRKKRMPDCISITPKLARSLSWLPETCGYRRVAERRDLEPWHPLRSGNAASVHEAGASVQDWARSEAGVAEDDVHLYIIGEADDGINE